MGEGEMDITGGGPEAACALDILLQGALEVEEMKIDMLHFLFRGRDCLARELKFRPNAVHRRGREEEGRG